MNPFPALFILVVIPSVFKGIHGDTCSVLPRDLNIEEGSDAQITCQTSCVRGKVFWTLDNTRVDDRQSKSNSTHTVLTLRNFSRSRATIQCNSAFTGRVLGGTIVTSYPKPTNLSCILHYDNQTTGGFPDLFTCEWEHRDFSALEINYTVLCASCSNQTELCRSQETTCTRDYYDIGDVILYGNYYSVVVRAESVLETFSDPYGFTPLKITKITQPEVNVTAVTDHIWVSSRIRSYPSVYRYLCQVTYVKVLHDGTPEDDRRTQEMSDKWTLTIKNLESCSNYTFATRCALEGAPWSDWSPEKTIQVKLKKSDFKPRLWRKITASQKNGVRTVHAMWTKIPSECPEKFTYTIKQTPYNKDVTGGNDRTSLCGRSVCEVNQEAHWIELAVFRNELLLVEDSVYVPAAAESLPGVTDIQTSTMGGAVVVSWNAPLQEVSGYVIDYSHDGDQFYWKETHYTNATLSDLLDMKPYDITVTPLLDDKTGRGTQARQVCSRVGEPGSVTITQVHPNDKSAYVEWGVKSQEVCSGVVVNYTVYYSATEGPQLNVTVDRTKRDIVLEGLNPETQYSIYVKAVAQTGSTKSKERFFETKRFDPKLGVVLGVSGSIVIALVLVVGLFCALQYKRFMEKPLPNPAHSSLALWPSATHKKAFYNPSESFCAKVHTEEVQTTSTDLLTSGCSDDPDINQTEGRSDGAVTPASDVQNEDPVNPVNVNDQSSDVECKKLLSSENSLSTPYWSQSPVETGRTKQYSRAPVQQQGQTAPPTVYVTLDMFEQGQSR
ncbi:interleukin-6 receptor subunit beta-like isoform X2 [Antennarius striatus]|uniref:interleukin-6 receptor subunit beta-like isoform X2 n=1 Tax=Antennarius striatus TaxID=241820 RepID=UPI0035AD7A6B